jgi:hypothetical protein
MLDFLQICLYGYVGYRMGQYGADHGWSIIKTVFYCLIASVELAVFLDIVLVYL